MEIALGFRPHTTWTVVVAAGPVGMPVVERRQLELGVADLPDQVYHAARDLDIAAATELVRRGEQAFGDTAAAGVRDLVADLAARGHTAIAAGVPTSSARVPGALSRILTSHTLLHAAEGQLVQTALAEAATAQGLAVYQAPARELAAHARTMLGCDEPTLTRILADLGRDLGPPWRRDQKDATLAAWLALGSVAD